MKFTVYYSRVFREGHERGWKRVTELRESDYVKVCEIEGLAHLDGVYDRMQGEFMAYDTRLYLQEMCKAGETDHTSMSVGDLVVAEDKAAWLCTPLSWTEVKVLS